MPPKNNKAILDHKYYDESSVFLPENLLREARRQKDLEHCPIPKICILDPDGDFCRWMQEVKGAKQNDCWAGYHSQMYTLRIDDVEVGIVPNIVGASFAVLVAEQLFVSGCECLISITSAGIINKPSINKSFALITEAIRDEGTSYHYLSPDAPATIGQKDSSITGKLF